LLLWYLLVPMGSLVLLRQETAIAIPGFVRWSAGHTRPGRFCSTNDKDICWEIDLPNRAVTSLLPMGGILRVEDANVDGWDFRFGFGRSVILIRVDDTNTIRLKNQESDASGSMQFRRRD